MPKVKNNYCYGCADFCHYCGRQNDIEEYACDSCGEILSEYGYKMENEYLCKDCAWEYIFNNLQDEVLSKYKCDLEDFM